MVSSVDKTTKDSAGNQSLPGEGQQMLASRAIGLNPETLCGIDAFRHLTVAERKAVAQYCSCHHFHAGEQILSFQDTTDDVFFIVSGQVQAINYSAAGQQVTLQDLAAGQMFGEMSAIDGEPRCACILAVSDALLISLTAVNFRQLLWRYPAVGEATLKRLTSMVRHLRAQVFERDALPAKQRVWAELLRRAHYGADRSNTAVISPAPTHGDVATHIGTRRETVSREMAHLRELGLLKRRGNDLLICDLKRLTQMLAED